MHAQKDKFSLPDDVTYLNCAYMSPLSKKVEAAGIAGLRRKSIPFSIQPDDFFAEAQRLKSLYAKLIRTAEPQRVVVVPSVSYGLAAAAKNAKIERGDNIVVLEEQFPSNIYTWQRLAAEKGAEVRFVNAPATTKKRGEKWNEKLLQAIDKKTAVAALPHVHWADGTRFDLEKVSEKVHADGGLLIIDGTQSVGAMDFDVTKVKPDALICGGYKWLMGGYSFGLAYYGAAFDAGIPLEENWMNRLHSENLRELVNYQPEYKSHANRYAVGQQSQFINTPMAIAGIEQINEWTPAGIQNYCKELIAEPLRILEKKGCITEEEKYRGNHLFGIRLAAGMDMTKLQNRFAERKIIVSIRGNAVRISPHVYNDAADFEKLTDCF